MRIAHFSDIHAGSWIRGMSGYFDKRLLGAFNFLLRRKLNQNWNFVDLAVQKIKQIDPDIVICTGDIATIASNHEFTKAKDALAPLVEDTRFEFLFIPGNHDWYEYGQKGLSRQEVLVESYLSKHKTNQIVTGNISDIIVRLESINSFNNG